MPLDETRLTTNLKTMFLDAEANGGDNRDDQLQYFCSKLSHVLITEIKQLHINYINGLAAPNGAVGGTINHTVS